MHTRTHDIPINSTHVCLYMYTNIIFDTQPMHTRTDYTYVKHMYTLSHYTFVCTITCFCIRKFVCIFAQAFAANALLACANIYACTYIINIYTYQYMCVATIIYKHKCIFAQVLGGYVSRIDKIVGLLAE